jgi:ketosteroid isomerase-like protein
MKRYGTVGSSIFFILTLVVTGYGQGQPPAVVTPSHGPADALRDEIVAHERAGLDALKTGDLTLFGATTAEDAVFVDAHGPATKAEVMEHTAEFRLKDYTMTDVRFVRLSAESGLIAYAITESGTSHGHDFSARVYVSALWVKRGGKWMCVFSQETGAK